MSQLSERTLRASRLVAAETVADAIDWPAAVVVHYHRIGLDMILVESLTLELRGDPEQLGDAFRRLARADAKTVDITPTEAVSALAQMRQSAWPLWFRLQVRELWPWATGIAPSERRPSTPSGDHAAAELAVTRQLLEAVEEAAGDVPRLLEELGDANERAAIAEAEAARLREELSFAMERADRLQAQCDRYAMEVGSLRRRSR